VRKTLITCDRCGKISDHVTHWSDEIKAVSFRVSPDELNIDEFAKDLCGGCRRKLTETIWKWWEED
jgi:hypothetical protein